MVTIGEKIKELRKQKKLTQEDLAKLLGLNRTTISKWERPGGSEPDIATIKKLADIFGVTTDYLLGHTDNPTKQRDLPQTAALLLSKPP